ncbi:response regulator [Vagococcus sp. DIV0080]|uniref:Response regulator n=1 Tax=Candidatus Vagococcus giribetii TaxID=2230876 RepID=A0ABS3HT76_9ENTE|nr:response regulator [Vagococcus sp. DIV0080]MBO0476954.1 response regulator [Vagococcus sp. DIV0080]
MPKTVLVVDDAVFMRMKLKDVLEKNNYQVIAEAKNGVEAIASYKAKRPDFVLMDIVMPEMDGMEALKRIRKLDPDAKVIICSAMGQQNIVLEAVREGAIDFIVKPFEDDRLIKSLDQFSNRV